MLVWFIVFFSPFFGKLIHVHVEHRPPAGEEVPLHRLQAQAGSLRQEQVHLRIFVFL